MLSFISEALLKSMTTVFYLALILIPIMIITEYANHFKLLEKLTRLIGWLPHSLLIPPIFDGNIQ